MHRDVDGVGGHVEHRADLPPGEIRAVAERDQLAVAFAELRDGVEQRKATNRILGQVAGRRAILDGPERVVRIVEGTVHTPTSDPDQPRHRLSALRVVALAVAKRALEDVARDVLGIHPRADPVCDVCVHRADQALRMGEWVAAHHAFARHFGRRTCTNLSRFPPIPL